MLLMTKLRRFHVVLSSRSINKYNSATYVENFETGNIQYTNEVLSLLVGVQSFVTFLDQPFEQPVKHGFGHGTNRVGDLRKEIFE